MAENRYLPLTGGIARTTEYVLTCYYYYYYCIMVVAVIVITACVAVAVVDAVYFVFTTASLVEDSF